MELLVQQRQFYTQMYLNTTGYVKYYVDYIVWGDSPTGSSLIIYRVLFLRPSGLLGRFMVKHISDFNTTRGDATSKMRDYIEIK
jgi:hypothetical protein